MLGARRGQGLVAGGPQPTIGVGVGEWVRVAATTGGVTPRRHQDPPPRTETRRPVTARQLRLTHRHHLQTQELTTTHKCKQYLQLSSDAVNTLSVLSAFKTIRFPTKIYKNKRPLDSYAYPYQSRGTRAKLKAYRNEEFQKLNLQKKSAKLHIIYQVFHKWPFMSLKSPFHFSPPQPNGAMYQAETKLC